MKSSITPEFLEAYAALPLTVRKAARRNYRLWLGNPRHSSIQFKHIVGAGVHEREINSKAGRGHARGCSDECSLTPDSKVATSAEITPWIFFADAQSSIRSQPARPR